MSRLTLTFDNGPDPVITPQVLACLETRAVPATFFAVGQRLQRPGARSLLEGAVAAGHRVGNHSMSHAVPFGDDPSVDVVEREIVATQRLIGDLGGEELLFRPFGGGGRIGPHLFNRRVLDHLVAFRYTVVLWNSVPRDWEDPAGWPAQARRDMANRDWTVLVLHDLPTGAMDHLPGFLDAVLADGVDVVSDFPDDCVPIRSGTLCQDLAPLTSA